jgi:HSP20 family protein
MTAKDSRGFFERLTGARILDRDDAEENGDFEVETPQDIPLGSAEDEGYLDEALDEADHEPEKTYSDEDTGSDENEQEGQLTVDVFQDETHVVIQSTIAGVSPEDLDVSITNDMVTIRGERRQGYEARPEDYFYQECYWGTFSRSIILPVEIDADRAEAKIKNGILTIRIPKANTAVTRKLKVKAT